MFRVTEKRELATDVYLYRLEAPRIAARGKAVKAIHAYLTPEG